MKKTIFVGGLIVASLVAAGVLWMSYIGMDLTSTKRSAETLYTGKIKIGTAPWPGYLGLYVAHDKGFFKEAGLDVDILSYPSLADLSDVYRSRDLMGRGNLNFDLVTETYEGVPSKLVVVIDYSNGSDGIIAKSDIQDVTEVRGKKVGVERGTMEEFLLRYVLKQNDVEIESIEMVDLNPVAAADALVAGTVDVAVTYEPSLGAALDASGGNKIHSTADTPGLIVDALTFHADFVKEHPETVQAIVEAYFRGVAFWKENPEETHELLAKWLETTPDKVPAQIEGVKILTVEENETAFAFSSGLESIYGNMRQTADFVREIREGSDTDAQIDTDNLMEPRFIRNFMRKTRDI